MVSKLAWGLEMDFKKLKEERKAFEGARAELGLDDASPLHSRGLRDHYEHFDARLVEWARQSPETASGLTDSNIGPESTLKDVASTFQGFTESVILSTDSLIISPESHIQAVTPDRPGFMRNFDPSTSVLMFLGHRAEVTPIRDALIRVIAVINRIAPDSLSAIDGIDSSAN